MIMMGGEGWYESDDEGRDGEDEDDEEPGLGFEGWGLGISDQGSE